MSPERLSGWGRSSWSVSDVDYVRSVDDVSTALRNVSERGAIARGLGRSYGDAAQNTGGLVLAYSANGAMSSEVSVLELDESTGVLRVGSMVDLESIIDYCVPRGWFVPVTPGTRYVTVGGAIAADIHGKNHHRDGSFGHHVLSITVLLSSGEVVILDRNSRPSWFWATIGGMGLTGFVIEVIVQMIRVSSPLMNVRTQQVSDIEHLMAIMGDTDEDDTYQYSVAWVDVMSSKSGSGRGVLTRGNHHNEELARESSSSTKRRSSKIEAQRGTIRVTAPKYLPKNLLNHVTVRAFNEMWFRRAPRRPTDTTESISSFFHPLDGVQHWNRLYGSSGFIQYQFIVPLDKGEVVQRVVQEMNSAKLPAFLAVLKRMGNGNEGPLSFPQQGWTFAVDLPVRHERLTHVLASCDEQVLDAGGRHYLAKDAHLTPKVFRRGYPRLSEWQSTRDEMDPAGVWQSDLSRRLHLGKGH